MSLSVCISHWSFPICSRGKNGVCSNIPRIVNTGCGNSLNSFSFSVAQRILYETSPNIRRKNFERHRNQRRRCSLNHLGIKFCGQHKSNRPHCGLFTLGWSERLKSFHQTPLFCTHKPLSLLFIYLWHRLRTGNIGCSINLLCLQNTARNIIYRELGWRKDEIFDTSNVNRQKQYILQLRMRVFQFKVLLFIVANAMGVNMKLQIVK